MDDWTDVIVSLTVFLFFDVMMLYFCWIKPKKAKKAIKQLHFFMHSDGELVVHDRNPLYAKIIKCKPHKVDTYNYVNEKIHVGAVTAGNVTTGGVYKTGGYYNTESYRDGRYELFIKDLDDSDFVVEKPIKTIRIGSELKDQVKNSSIEKYTDKNFTINVVEDVRISAATAAIIQAGYTMTGIEQANIDKSQGYPSKEKCTDIIHWLCGQNDSEQSSESSS